MAIKCAASEQRARSEVIVNDCISTLTLIYRAEAALILLVRKPLLSICRRTSTLPQKETDITALRKELKRLFEMATDSELMAYFRRYDATARIRELYPINVAKEVGEMDSKIITYVPKGVRAFQIIVLETFLLISDTPKNRKLAKEATQKIISSL